MPFNPQGWRPTDVHRFVTSYRTALRTARVDTDAGEGFLKALGNPEGPHQLVCELIGSLAADWLGLKTLDFSLIEIKADDEIPLDQGVNAHAGPAFISRAEDNGFTWGGDPQTLNAVTEAPFSRLIVVDTWLRNCDRHSPDGRRVNLGNVFLVQKTEPRCLELVAMDFTHAFTCGSGLDRRLTYIDCIKDPSVFGYFGQFRPFVKREEIVSAAFDCQNLRRPKPRSLSKLSRMLGR